MLPVPAKDKSRIKAYYNLESYVSNDKDTSGLVKYDSGIVASR